MFLSMVLIRTSETAIADLVAKDSDKPFEEREIQCPCHLYEGQEAVAAGVCAVLNTEDMVYSTHRSHGHYLAKGGDLNAMFAEIFCRSTGCSRGYGGSMHLVAPEVGFPGSSAIVGGTIPLAVGSALAFSIRGEERVAVSFFGDGAATEGVFYESLNFAALKKLPVVFVCENNFYSTHMAITEIQSNPDIHEKAEAFDMPSERVDGYSAVDVYRAASEAVSLARQGGGPTLIECMTYRWRGHVGPNYDIQKGLRDKAEVDAWIDSCAVKRLEDYMLADGLMSSGQRDGYYSRIQKEVQHAIDEARRSPWPGTENSLKVFK